MNLHIISYNGESFVGKILERVETLFSSTLELHLSGLSGTASHPYMQKNTDIWNFH
jgi:hypothetical protein